MRHDAYLTLRARSDLASAHLWYQERGTDLAADFLGEIDAVLAQLSRFPHSCPVIHKNIRRCLVHRFPYGLFYVVESRRIVILAIMHQARDPKRWQDLV
jgi:plasmid stabilization system protein ParE